MVNAIGEVKGQGHIVNSVFNQCTSFSIQWQSDQPFQRYDMKNTSKILKKYLSDKTKKFPTEFPQN